MNTLTPDQQIETSKTLWRYYRDYAATARRLKSEQGQWRRILLFASTGALIAAPASETLAQWDYKSASTVLSVTASVLFALVVWLNESLLGEDAQQPWVRARQTAESMKALTFRFLAGIAPFDVADAQLTALTLAEAIVTKTDVQADAIEEPELKDLPPIPLNVDNFIATRVDNQIRYYKQATAAEQISIRRMIWIGRAISLAVALMGAAGAVLAQTVRDIWAPALGSASALLTTQLAVARRKFLVDTYSLTAAKLQFALARWNSGAKGPSEEAALVATTEDALASENAGWVQQMLLKPVVPDSAPAKPEK